MKKLIVLMLILALIPIVMAQNTEHSFSPHSPSIYFFYSYSCTHCADAKPFLDDLERRYNLSVFRYEIHNKENTQLFHEIAVQHHTTSNYVPAFFIEDEAIIGFNDDIAKKIEKKIKSCLDICEYNETDTIVHLPWFGDVDTTKMSLPLFTIIIGGLDGINPCAIWVLCFLLSLLIYARSRKRIIMIGSIFVFASAFVYFLFMTAWFNLFMFIGYRTYIVLLLGILAIVIGAINIKDFFWFKKGISLAIAEKHKPKLFKKMRKIVYEHNIFVAVIGTLLLAFFVNLIELGCSIGLPAIYTKILQLQNLPTITKYLYLILYNLVYIVPLALIVAIFAITMGAKKLTEKQGRILKLISGLLLFILGIILLINPSLLVFK